MEEVDSQSTSLRLRRQTSGWMAQWHSSWANRWFRLGVYALCVALLGWLFIYLVFARDLPSVDRLQTYQPPLPTNVRGVDGTPVHSYARERRVQLRYDEYPQLLVRAYLSAEDKHFFRHACFDPIGILRAAWKDLRENKMQGASTISQRSFSFGRSCHFSTSPSR